MTTGAFTILAVLTAVAIWYILRWYALERRRQHPEGRAPTVGDLITGFLANFFDTLGIGSFATTTAVFKFRKRMPDDQIPGTLNAGHALPTVAEALIFIAVVSVDLVTLVSMIAASVLGAWLGVGVVARLPKRAIQIGMGVALLVSAVLFIATNMQWMPGGGDALGLHGIKLAIGVGVSFMLGALMMVGIGLYGPCLILVAMLGMNPLAAFPIMMGSCAFLMPTASMRIVQTRRYNMRAAVGLALGGIPGVLLAAFVVKSLPIVWLRWLVVAVVIYAALLMLFSARRPPQAAPATT